MKWQCVLLAALMLGGCRTTKRDSEVKIAGGDQLRRASRVGKAFVTIVTADPISDFRQLCSGTLIAPDVVLTASHCFASATIDPGFFRVIFSVRPDLIRDYLTSTLSYRIRKIIVHPERDIRSLTPENILGPNPQVPNDLALVLLAGPVSGAEPIPIADSTTRLTPEDSFHVFGSGISGFGDSQARPQRPARSLSIQLERPLTDAKAILFTTNNRSEQRVCSGDSGGPTTIREGQNTELVGVNMAVGDFQDPNNREVNGRRCGADLLTVDLRAYKENFIKSAMEGLDRSQPVPSTATIGSAIDDLADLSPSWVIDGEFKNSPFFMACEVRPGFGDFGINTHISVSDGDIGTAQLSFFRINGTRPREDTSATVAATTHRGDRAHIRYDISFDEDAKLALFVGDTLEPIRPAKARLISRPGAYPIPLDCELESEY